ncbi:MAG: TonB-dependent receptor domain-containing protein [Novosphingobium sp.]
MQLGAALAGGLALMPHAACAQRASDNVITQSSDAFGRSVGNEKSGLYTTDDVRGFNPVDAGNVRLEGLYFDQIERVSTRLIDGNTIRVGPASQRYPFPAPTGLVDYSLTQPHGKTSYSINLDNGSSSSLGVGGSFEFKQPLGSTVGLSGGFGFRNLRRTEGGTGFVRTFGGTFAWRPAKGAELLLFAGDFRFRSDEARPTLFLSGTGGPPQLERGKDLSPTWTGKNSDTWLYGAIGKAPLGQHLRLESGLFYTRRDLHRVFADLYTGVLPDGSTSGHKIVADAGSFDASLSGETRLVRQWSSGTLSQQLTLSLRGRHKVRRFGGTATFQFGPSSLLANAGIAEPAYTIGPKNRDRVDQLTYGAAWSLVSARGFSFDAGVSRSSYTKSIDFADPLLLDPVTRDRPVTWNLSASLALARGVSIYAGASHGQEEALIAPDVAINRSEAPPAIHTRQIEGGLKLALTPHMTLIAGAFTITKPYYNLDPSLRYRQLGSLNNRGLEFSLTGQIVPGVNVVGGLLLLDPRISGEAVTSGQIGPRPVGQVRSHAVANFDWRLDGGKAPLSFDLAIESFSSRVGNSANTVNAAPRTTVNLGARYRFKLGKSPFLVRPLIQNLFDNYGWQVSTSGGWTYAAPRSLIVQVVADF